MKKNLFRVVAVTATIMASAAAAQNDATLNVEGQEFTTRLPAPDHLDRLSEVASGWLFRSEGTQALQTDDFDNPGFVFIDQALELYEQVDGSQGESCSSCHTNVEEFAGLRTTLPRVENGELVTMEDLINECRTDRMGAEPWRYERGDMTSMTALIGLQSRGMPMNVAIDGDATPFWELGQELYNTRFGQLNMACTQCHDNNYGNNLRADHLSQGQTNGFPSYRLKNARLNSPHSRFAGCMVSIRAEPFDIGSEELKSLELFIASRGQGLSVETPSVRN